MTWVFFSRARPRLEGGYGRSCLRMIGRLGNVLPTSVNPARVNMATVPVNTAEGDGTAASAATSTGCPSTTDPPCSRAHSTAAPSKETPAP